MFRISEFSTIPVSVFVGVAACLVTVGCGESVSRVGPRAASSEYDVIEPQLEATLGASCFDDFDCGLGFECVNSKCVAVAPSPEEQIGDLEDAVEDLLNAGTFAEGETTALTGTLSAALDALDRGDTEAATKQLMAFIQQVNAMVTSGRLTVEEGLALIDAAQATIDSIDEGV